MTKDCWIKARYMWRRYRIPRENLQLEQGRKVAILIPINVVEYHTARFEHDCLRDRKQKKLF
jgi:hypothetical protein